MSSLVRRLALFSLIAACGKQSSPSSSAQGSTSPQEPAGTGCGSSSPDVPAPAPSASVSVPDAAPPAALDAAIVDPGPPRVRFVGRFDTSDSSGPVCAWPGCRIVANFDGTQVSVKLDEIQESWMQGGPSEWDVAIDGQLLPKLVLTPGPSVYTLATGLPRGHHTVELYKRTETQNGYTRFLGYDFGDGTLLPPPPAATRRIEMIGDSAAAGFGVDSMGLGPNCPGPNWAAKYQNFREAFAARLGEMLGADVTGSVYSGKGIVKDIWRSDTETMPKIWTRANPVLTSSPFDLSSLVPDAILVMIGGNDFAIGQPSDDGPLDPTSFTSGYRAFVDQLRSTYPRAHIWLIVSPSVSDDEPPGRMTRTNIANAVHAIASGGGDPRLHEVTPRVATQDELVGCNGHGTPAFHQRVATELAAILRPELGW